MKIMVVDDSRAIREVLDIALDCLGHEAVTAASGEEAVALLRSSPVDVVLADMKMPGLDGRQTLAAIRVFSHVPVVAMTADVELVENEGWRVAGFDGLLAKPVSVGALAQALAPFNTSDSNSPSAG